MKPNVGSSNTVNDNKSHEGKLVLTKQRLLVNSGALKKKIVHQTDTLHRLSGALKLKNSSQKSIHFVVTRALI